MNKRNRVLRLMAIFAALAIAGWLTVERADWQPVDFGVSIVAWLIISFNEELSFRGYILQRLAQALGDDERRGEVACRQARYAVVVGEHQAAIAYAREAVERARGIQDTRREAEGHCQWGWALYCLRS